MEESEKNTSKKDTAKRSRRGRPGAGRAHGKYEVTFDDRKLSRLNALLGLLAVLIIVYIIFAFCIGLSRVTGNSMAPTLENGQIVMYTKIFTHPEKGDIIAITTPAGDHYIKRVIAGPGDTVNISGGKVTVNGKTPATERLYASGNTEADSAEVSFPLTVGEDMYFVLGDNRAGSVDSRTFGPVSSAQIDGVILGG
jgi:signal peptidase I